MKCAVIVNSYFDSEDYLYQAKRLQEEFTLLGVTCDILKNDTYLVRIVNNDVKVSFDYDFVIFWDKDKYLLRLLDKAGYRVFNNSKAIEICDDKMLTYIELAKNAIRIPNTIPGLLCFTKDAKIQHKTIYSIENALSYPMIIKESYGSLGKGIYLVKDREELINTLEKVKMVPHLIQEYIKESKGMDIRVIVIGGKAIGAMKRESSSDFRSNIGAGGKGTVYPMNDELISISEKISEVLNLDYCGIDLLLGEDGYIVCEVNSNAFFKTFEKATSINVANQYAKYILSKLG